MPSKQREAPILLPELVARTIVGFAVIQSLVIPCPAAGSAQVRVEAAIESLRGLTSEVSAKDRLTSAREFFRKNKRVAIPLIRKALETNRQDDFVTLNLSACLLRLSPGLETMEEVARFLLKADPNVSPGAFFEAASMMAAAHCQACLPAVLKILEVRYMDVKRPNLETRVGIIHARVLTLGQFGDLSIPEVMARLASSECTIRANAAALLGDLQPVSVPVALVNIARNDTCPQARIDALQGLTLLRDPELKRSRLGSSTRASCSIPSRRRS